MTSWAKPHPRASCDEPSHHHRRRAATHPRCYAHPVGITQKPSSKSAYLALHRKRTNVSKVIRRHTGPRLLPIASDLPAADHEKPSPLISHSIPSSAAPSPPTHHTRPTPTKDRFPAKTATRNSTIQSNPTQPHNPLPPKTHPRPRLSLCSTSKHCTSLMSICLPGPQTRAATSVAKQNVDGRAQLPQHRAQQPSKNVCPRRPMAKRFL